MAKRKLRLFVAEGVLCDWSCGIIIVAAYDEDHARKLMNDQGIYSDYGGDNEPIVFREMIAPECIIVHGGG